MLAKSKLILMVLLTSMEEKAFARSIAVYQLPKDGLVYSNNYTKTGTTAATRLIT